MYFQLEEASREKINQGLGMLFGVVVGFFYVLFPIALVNSSSYFSS